MDDIQSSEVTPVIQLADMPVVPTPPQPGFDKTKLILPISILIAGLMVSGAILHVKPGTDDQNAAIGQGAQTPQHVDIDLSDAPSMGDPNAPVTVVEFGDFQCPFCQRYAQSVQ